MFLNLDIIEGNILSSTTGKTEEKSHPEKSHPEKCQNATRKKNFTTSTISSQELLAFICYFSFKFLDFFIYCRLV